MKNIKKFLIVLTALMLSVCVAFSVSCKKENSVIPQLSTTPSVELNYEKLKMEIGSSFTLSATLENFEEQPQVEWYSFNENIVSVKDGVVKALGNGTTSVVAQVGTYSASCEVVVLEAVVEKNDLNLTISQKTAVLNANSQVKTVNLTATVTVNGVIVNAPVEWQSSDEDYATVENGVVTAIKNGKEVIITAKATYQGSTVTAICKVSTEDFAVIIVNQPEIVMYAGDQPKAIDFDLYVGGQINEQEKENVSFSVKSGVGVVKIENGNIVALNDGNAVVTVNYQNKSAEINVTVGKIAYVETAEQFMAIDGAKSMNRFILKDNIDLSAYFTQNPAINSKYLIESFDGELIGNGYSISGYQRFATSTDGGFSGLFNEIGENAIIDGVNFNVETFVKDDSSLVANNNYGQIRNSVFNFKSVTPVSTLGNCLFEISNGKVENSVFTVEYVGDASNSKISVANNGYGTYENIFIVADGSLTQNVEGCSLYATQSDLISANVLDGQIFTTNEKVALKNDGNGKTFVYPQVSFDSEYATAQVGQSFSLGTASVSDGAVLTCKLFNQNKKDLSDNVVDNSIVITAKGAYYVLHVAQNNGVFSGVLKEFNAVEILPEINATTKVLKVGETFNVSVDGKDMSGYSLVSSNAEVVAVENATVKALKQGKATVTVVEIASGNKYKVLFTVVEDYEIIDSKEKLLAIGEVKDQDGNVTQSNAGKLFVLATDITLTQEDFISEQVVYNDKGNVATYKYAIGEFAGVLDGQGHKITVILEDYTAVMVGLIKTVKRGAMVKNLNYYAEVHYTPANGSAYQSAFIYTLSGNLENCYVKADLYPTKEPGDSIGLVGWFRCETGFPQTATIRNCIFEMQTIYDGQILDQGYAVRVGFSPFGYAYDSVFIRNGLTATFFGDHGHHGSAVECTRTNFYKSVYDFVHANNGYNFSTGHVANKLPDGEQIYLTWPSEWTINEDGIYLLGKRVCGVERVPYAESKTITISESKGVLTWISDATEFEVVINDKTVATTQEKTFNVYEFIVNNYGTKTADYNVMIKATGRSGVAVYSIIELNSENFVSQMREIDSAQKREFKYFVFNSSVTVNWSNAKVGYMFDKAYANVDGRGYTLTVNAQNAPQDFQGLFYACYGLWTNTVIKLNAEYASGANSKTYLVGSFYEGGIENCVIWVNATAYDQSGKVVTQPSAQLIGYPSVKASYTNNLFVLSGGADTLINIFGAMSDGGPYLRNSAVIRDTDSHDMTPTFEEGGNKGFTNVIHYRTLSDFILGNGTKYERGVNGELTATLTVVKLKPIYEGWSSVWEISEDKVTLMGKIVFQSVETGDDFISDSDIK